MTPREQGFLLLTAKLGDAQRQCLTMAQYRALLQAVRASARPPGDRSLVPGDLTALGCDDAAAERIVGLLSQQRLLDGYLRAAASRGCACITRLGADYPKRLHERLGLDAPACLWISGNGALLSRDAVALVGSRDIAPENREFAAEVGRRAAQEGLVLISGNARGADQAAQSACLRSGGSVISVVADELYKHRGGARLLYVSEDGFDVPFSPQRALQRNRIIHALGKAAYVAQCSLNKGGSWDGAMRNLRHRWSALACFDDGSEASRALIRAGAVPVRADTLGTLGNLPNLCPNFLDA